MRGVSREIRICKCGCKETFICKENSKQGYINGHYVRGRVTWNKNLTKHTDERLLRLSKRVSDTMKGVRKSKVHGKNISKGRKGMVFSEEHCRRIGLSSAKRWEEEEYREKTKQSHISDPKCSCCICRILRGEGVVGAGTGIGGVRPDLNQYFRSRWEANVARILNYEELVWKYEHKSFLLIRSNGTKVTYRPDFNVEGVWWEVKGYMRPEDREKIELFKQQYCEESFILVDAIKYNQLKSRYKKLIPNWEK